MIEASRFEAAVKDPSPFVIVLGDRRSGKTELIKRRISKNFGTYNALFVPHLSMRSLFDDVVEHIDMFYTDYRDFRGQSGVGKNLFIDEFSLAPDLIQSKSFLPCGWSTITMVSSKNPYKDHINLSGFNQVSIHDWYRNTQYDLPSSVKFRLMAAT